MVLPAEKARVIAKIGTEKKSAFDLLQDAEQATAYGCRPHYNSDPTNTNDLNLNQHANHHANQHANQHAYNNNNYEKDHDLPPPLPASISLRRCSHFGDTMHFIDSLTQISLDLRLLPTLDRNVSTVSLYKNYVSLVLCVSHSNEFENEIYEIMLCFTRALYFIYVTYMLHIF